MTASCRQGDAVTKKRKIEIQYKANKPLDLFAFIIPFEDVSVLMIISKWFLRRRSPSSSWRCSTPWPWQEGERSVPQR